MVIFHSKMLVHQRVDGWIPQVSSLKMQQPSAQEDDQFLSKEQRAREFWIQIHFPQHWKRICNHTSSPLALVSLVECPIETLILDSWIPSFFLGAKIPWSPSGTELVSRLGSDFHTSSAGMPEIPRIPIPGGFHTPPVGALRAKGLVDYPAWSTFT